MKSEFFGISAALTLLAAVALMVAIIGDSQEAPIAINFAAMFAVLAGIVLLIAIGKKK